MQISESQIRSIAKRRITKTSAGNMRSVLAALDLYGSRTGLDQAHRLAQYLAQLLHESGEFRYDREIWGPTAQQKKYDTGKLAQQLGNTPAADGDGKKYMGHTAGMITGRANTEAFRDWCRATIGGDVPDFVADPAAMNTDPWEGLGPIWYWDTRDLNRYADQGDIETISMRWNGGLIGYASRCDYYARTALVLLGYGPTDIRQFQASKGLTVDGDAGPRTRAALHLALVALTDPVFQEAGVKAAPVTVEKKIPVRTPVVPAPLDKPVTHTSGFWERMATIVGVSGLSGASWLGDWRVVTAIAAALIVLAVLGLILHKRIIDAVRDMKAARA